MSRILLADDSPHAQRMGEFILRDEGFEVVSVTDGETALMRLRDVDPDLVVADILMPRRSGYEICEFVKNNPLHKHTKVVLTAGAHETIDEQEALRVHADGWLQKPFEASVMMELFRPLIDSASAERVPLWGEEVAKATAPAAVPALEDLTKVRDAVREALAASAAQVSRPAAPESAPEPQPLPIDPERVRAAVAIALDEAMSDMIDKVTEKVLVALGSR